MTVPELNATLGNIDIYLLDQLLKGRYAENDSLLDAGCGEGRNIIYFMNNNFDVHGLDNNPKAIQMLQFVARSNGGNPAQFILGDLKSLPYKDQFFNHIIVSAVLHFAKNDHHFHTMFGELVRVLKLNGSLFVRMTSNIGIEDCVKELGSGQHLMPDGTQRYLITREMINQLLRQYQLSFLEPVKTVNVSDKRCMTTLVLSKK